MHKHGFPRRAQCLSTHHPKPSFIAIVNARLSLANSSANPSR